MNIGDFTVFGGIVQGNLPPYITLTLKLTISFKKATMRKSGVKHNAATG
jgi:hypothetical protein